MKNILITGARENNLKNIDISIPRNEVTCLVGVSGSGKSSIAYNIIYSEGQRQFMESVSTFAARLLKRTGRPDIDDISNLSPTISIDQKRLRGNPRSTVGTTTEIYTYLRLLFSRFGSDKFLSAGHFSFNNPKGACKQCKGLGVEFTIDPHSVIDFDKSLSEGASRHNNYKPGARLYNILQSSGKLDMDKKIQDYTDDELYFLLYTERVEMSSKGQGFVQRFSHEGIITRLKKRAGDLRGTSKLKEKTDKPYVEESSCSTCNGGRLNERALSSKIDGKDIGYYANLELDTLKHRLRQVKINDAQPLINRLVENVQNLIDVKLGYLSLNRSLETLSGGEAQRLKLARELGNNLIEMVYILDEPTSGLHPRDKENIFKIVKSLKDSGNTVIMIEHDGEAMKQSDHIIELGPGAGKQGGNIITEGKFDELLNNPKSITAPYLKPHTHTQTHKRKQQGYLEITNANIHNLKNISCNVPLGVLCAFTGVSGSGKSSLLIDVLAKQHKEDVIIVDQKPLSGSARGNSATYVGVFNDIRILIAQENNVDSSLFTFNGKGACPDCKGLGYKKMDMHFMGDVISNCETCLGKRYKKDTLQYKLKGKNISEILDMTIRDAYGFFDESKIKKKLQILLDVGLDYLELGQSHDTLSGGEAQRLKLAKQLHKKGEIYIVDEPTSGLHYKDIEHLMKLFNTLIDNGNTVLAIEHNLAFISQADWIIDLGPEGGDKGGEIVAEGTPEEVIKHKKSYTGQYLRKHFGE